MTMVTTDFNKNNIALKDLSLQVQLHIWSDNSHNHLCYGQGIIGMNRNGNSANFFSYVCNDKKSKELFASFLNGIPISVMCFFYDIRF